MQLFFLCVCLLPLPVSPEILKVEPDSDQFFSREPIALKCKEQWSVKRNRTGSAQVQSCGIEKGFGQISGSSCFIHNPSPSDSGVYWCESAAGHRGPQRPLSVTERDLILDSPTLPVSAGSDITLRCRTRPGSGLSPVLVKEGAVVHNGSEWSFTVSKEHEGEYFCKDQEKESERRSLRVTDPPTTTPSTSSPSTSSPSTSSPSTSSPTSSPLSPLDGGAPPPGFTAVLLGALGGLALLGLALGLVLVFFRRRRTQTGSDPEAEDVTYTDVTVRRAARAPPPGRQEDVIYSGVQTRPKGPEELTYGEVTIKPNDKKKKKKKRRREDPNGLWNDLDVVYSSVRTRGSGGARPDPR